MAAPDTPHPTHPFRPSRCPLRHRALTLYPQSRSFHPPPDMATAAADRPRLANYMTHEAYTADTRDHMVRPPPSVCLWPHLSPRATFFLALECSRSPGPHLEPSTLRAIVTTALCFGLEHTQCIFLCLSMLLAHAIYRKFMSNNGICNPPKSLHHVREAKCDCDATILFKPRPKKISK